MVQASATATIAVTKCHLFKCFDIFHWVIGMESEMSQSHKEEFFLLTVRTRPAYSFTLQRPNNNSLVLVQEVSLTDIERGDKIVKDFINTRSCVSRFCWQIPATLRSVLYTAFGFLINHESWPVRAACLLLFSVWHQDAT